jgi:hypothetical protein
MQGAMKSRVFCWVSAWLFCFCGTLVVFLFLDRSSHSASDTLKRIASPPKDRRRTVLFDFGGVVCTFSHEARHAVLA